MEMRLTFDVDDRIHMDYLAYLFERDQGSGTPPALIS